MSAIDFSKRSPYATARIPGMPPRVADVPRIRFSPNGTPMINGVPLAPAQQSVPPDKIEVPSRVTDGSRFGEALTVPIVFAAAGEQVALVRPAGATRISLLIQNLSVVGNVFYCFDRIADNVSCVAIAAGGNRLFDPSVPQGDLHVFSTGAGTVIVEYMNRNIDSINTR